MPACRSIVATALLVVVTLACSATPAVARLATPQRVPGPPPAEVAGIVNGSDVTAEEWRSRWMSIVAIAGSGETTRCGGTLIDARTVLTAAHCVHDRGMRITPDQLQVLVGRRDLAASDGEWIALERIDVHPSFHEPSMRFDVAALRLARAPLVPHAAIEPLAWHDAAWSQLGSGWAAGSDAVGPWIAGWGVTDPQRPAMQSELREAKVPVHSDAACGAASAPGLGWQFDPASMLCAGIAGNGTTWGGGVDACQGDSGGPLLVGDATGTLRLVGITSWGSGCAAERWGAWARVGAFTEWIDSVRAVPPVRPARPVEPPPTTPTGAGPAAPAPPDTTAPTTPGSLRARGVTATACTISWAASSDDRGVARYEVQWHTGRAWTHFSHEVVTSVAMRAMTPRGLYRFRVRARDGAGNASPWSTVLAVRMAADRTRPTRPGTPRVAMTSRAAVTVTWPRARDDVRVARYLIWHQSGRRWVLAARTTRPRATFRRPRARAIRVIRVQAVDGVGHRSLPSRSTRIRLR